MRTIDEELAGHPFFHGLEPRHLALVAGCATNTHPAPDSYLFHEGEPADAFYVVRNGQVAIETSTPTGSVVLDTVHAGEIVGWSWLVPPYRWTFDARVIDETSLVAVDGACLRGKCASDPDLGYALLQRVVGVMSSRLHSARVRLLDLYGGST